MTIDATFYGNEGWLLNHSCNPNCGSIIIWENEENKILIFSLWDIKKNEELTYDY